ncbi:MAG: MmgE/PrpD family protein [Pseudomonadota bacterium]
MAEVAHQLAAFAAAPLRNHAAAEQVLHMATADWLSVAIRGTSDPVSAATRAFLNSEDAQTGPTGLGFGAMRTAQSAAFLNGTTGHALDYDDTHFAHIGHPSTVILPAVFALAEAEGASPSQTYDACLIGLEASIRLGVWLGRGHYQVGFHQTATAGAFGAALGAGRVLGFGKPQLAQTLYVVASQAAGLKSQFGTAMKPLHAGLAARAGVEAALMVRAGLTGRPDALEGPQGFGATHHGADDLAALDGLGDTWLFEHVSPKFHACCHGIHAALEALQTLKPDPSEMAVLTVRSHPRWMTVCNQSEPDTGLGAKFSYSTAMALALLGEDTGALETWTDAQATRADVVALRKKIQVEAESSVTETKAVLRVLDQEGRMKDAEHDLTQTSRLETRRERVLRKSTALLGAQVALDLQKLCASPESIADLISFAQSLSAKMH